MKKTWQKEHHVTNKITLEVLDKFILCLKVIFFILLSILISMIIQDLYVQEPIELTSKEFVKSEDKDYNIHILTQEELSQLYECEPVITNTNTQIVDLTYEEAQLLLRVARAEAGPTLEGQKWSMRVILNRVQDKNFPDSIGEVVNQPNQFEVVSSGVYRNAEINENSHLALAEIEKGWDETEGSLYWEADSNSDHSWHKKNLVYIKTIEGNRYYK